MPFKILDSQNDRQVAATARSTAEANRKVGELNRACGSTSRYGWVFDRFAEAPRDTLRNAERLTAFNSRGRQVTVTIPQD
jgi:hypothetical protein